MFFATFRPCEWILFRSSHHEFWVQVLLVSNMKCQQFYYLYIQFHQHSPLCKSQNSKPQQLFTVVDMKFVLYDSNYQIGFAKWWECPCLQSYQIQLCKNVKLKVKNRIWWLSKSHILEHFVNRKLHEISITRCTVHKIAKNY